MAYYSSNYYVTDDHGEYYLTNYADDYDHSALNQEPVISYSSYEPSNQNFFQYDPTPTPHYHASHSAPTWPAISYSTSAYSNPISIENYPKFYEQSYDTSVTQFVISYSVSEFNEPEWEEYDPTPYDGGFDLAQTYGKPLSPSAETCYPRSATGLNPPSVNGVTDGAITLLSGKEEIDEHASKPVNENRPIQAVEEEKQQHQRSTEDHQPSQVLDDVHDTKEGNPNPNQVEEYNSGSGSYEYGKQGNQIPSGYGLEAMDICESLFGHWPCLSKRGNNGTCQELAGEGRYGNPWKGTADYLFGSSNPYGDRRDEESYYEGSTYAYERYYFEQHQNRQD